MARITSGIDDVPVALSDGVGSRQYGSRCIVTPASNYDMAI